MSSSSYEYKKLREPSKQIRLLTLLPSRNYDAPVHTRLSSVELVPVHESRDKRFRATLQLPSYFAISYVWGPPSQPEARIFVDGVSFKVSKNLEDALRRFRAYSSTPFRYWIDFICINQRDNVEKSQQIPLMPRIYAQAALVMIWLGNPTQDSERVTEFISRLTQSPLMIKMVKLFELDMPPLKALEAHGTTSSIPIWQRAWKEIIWICYSLLCQVGLSVFWMLRGFGNLVDNPRFNESRQKYSVESVDDFKMVPYNSTFTDRMKSASREGVRNRLNRQIKNHMDSVGTVLDREESQTENTSTEMTGASNERLANNTENDGVLSRTRMSSSDEPSTFWARFRKNYNRSITETRARRCQEAIARLKQMDDEDAYLRTNQTSAAWTPSTACLQSVALEDYAEMTQLMAKTLFGRTQYFSRMWTLQEATVKGQVFSQAFIAHGSMFIALSSIFNVVSYLDRKLGYEVEEFEKIARLQWISAEYHRGRRLPLQVLLYESRDRQCGNPRDKIYALQGLMYEQPTALLRPDYDLPVAVVYANATRFLISASQSLDIICGQEPSKAIDGLPSWTPDYSCFGTGNTVPLVDLSGRKVIHNASLREPPPRIPDINALPNDWQHLQVSGTHMGTIKSLSRQSDPGETIREMEQKWSVSLMKHFATVRGALPALTNISQLVGLYSDYLASHLHSDFWSSVPEAAKQVRDLMMSQREADQAARTVCNKYLSTLLCSRAFSGQELEKFIEQATIMKKAGDAAIETLCATILSSVRHRRLFVMDDADVWGAAPDHATEGDSVFVIIGCSVPVVLRKLNHGAEYRLVGECYCEGFMKGEALVGWEENAIDVNDIWLQ